MNINIKILDCTIRDGGHLNKWDFDPAVVRASYYAAVKSGADYFEAGYRFPATINGLGKFAYCDDDYMMSLLKVSEECKLTVMIDAGKCDSTLLPECKPNLTPFTAVRVASYPYELEKAISLVEDLKIKGYEVFLNLMASSEITDEQFGTLETWDNKEYLNAIYFADSFGAFVPSDISFHIDKLKNMGFENIGFHPHNNLQMAFANSLKAIEAGATYIDASIYGMGRGAGNLPIEIMIGYLEKKGGTKYNTVPYLDVLERFFLEIFKEFGWGYSLESFMGGIKDIHPYYVHNIFERHHYTIDEIWNALDIVKKKCPLSYSIESLDNTLGERFYTPLTEESVDVVFKSIKNELKVIPSEDAFLSGNADLKNRHEGKKFIVIANGPSIVEYKDKIDAFIHDTEGYITIGVNYLRDTFVPDYHMFINRKRFLNYLPTVNSKSTLIVPSFFGKKIIEENYTGQCSYFDIDSIDDISELPPFDGDTQKVAVLNVTISAILMAYQMGASEIFVVGMDGYREANEKQMVYFYNENELPDEKNIASLRYEKLCDELERINSFLQDKSVPMSIITPTSHKKYYHNILG